MSLLKPIYYTFFRPSLNKGILYRFGFIFHTEKIHARRTFDQLLKFCQAFIEITGKRALCVTMTPENPKIKKEMNEEHIDEKEFLVRLKKLNEVADIGYHGHFWKSGSESFHDVRNQLKPDTSISEFRNEVADQFEREVTWLRDLGFATTSYSGGWWLINPWILQLQKKYGIQYDFTFSQQAWVKNNWAKETMSKASIQFGEVFKSSDGNVIHTQTLMGCPNTGYPQDFVRILNSSSTSNVNPVGMITTHDYNIDSDNDLKNATELILYLKKMPQVSFFSIADLATTIVTKQIAD
mgnify:CR=1 FL=1